MNADPSTGGAGAQRFLYDVSDDCAIASFDRRVYERQLGWPGAFPFTRGIHADMYSKGRFPTVRKYGGFGTAEDFHAHLLQQLRFGVTGLSIAYDLPTQMGLDPDHPLAEGEVGVNGVSIACARDVEVIFDGLLPDMAARGLGVSHTINATAPVLLAFLIVAAKRQGFDPSRLRGTIQNDVLKEYLARNTYLYPLESTLRLTRDVLAYAAAHLPKFNPISISGYHIREKGATAAQELAFMFANAIQYCVTAQSAGLPIDRFAPQLSFFVNVKKDLFEEVAKLRAARRVWACLMRDGFGAADPRAGLWRVQVYTGGSDLRREKPQLNVARDAVRALTAALGGPQGVNVTSYDEVIGIPTELPQAIAIDTPFIIFLEKSVGSVVDPCGGSYYLEHLTDRIEREVWQDLNQLAGFPSFQGALGHMVAVIEEEALGEQRAEDSGERRIVGKNMAVEGAELYPPVTTFTRRETTASVGARRASLLTLRRTRGTQTVAGALSRLESVARNPRENIMSALIEAAECDATLGEISDVFQRVFGESSPHAPWEPGRPIPVFNDSLRSFIAAQAGGAAGAPRSLGRNYFVPSDVTYVKKEHPAHAQIPGRYPFRRGASDGLVGGSPVGREAGWPGDVVVDAAAYREAGATASEELTFALYEGLAAVREKIQYGLSPEAAAGGVVLRLSSHNAFFEEIAKFRAARELWAKALAARWTLTSDEGLGPRIHARTAASTLTQAKPWNNIVRTTLQALQGLLGGVCFLEIRPFDAPFGRTEWSDWADRLARDIAAMLQVEIGLDHVVDPLGGSFYLEQLTVSLVAAATTELCALEVLTPEDARASLDARLRSRPLTTTPVIGLNVQVEGPNPQPHIR